jgi:hypothetical protein
MNTARDQYLEHLALRRGADSCWWNAVILTASSPRQADSYRQEIELRKEQGRLPAGVLYLVVPDPRGDRIGSGGATLNALRTLAESVRGSYTGEAWWRRNRVLLIHSGGDSRRLPQYSPSGKLFTALPAKPPGAATTIFDETLALSTAWAERMPGGLLIGSGDVLLTFDAPAVDFDRAGVTGVAMRQPLEVGSQHGVYVTDGHDRVYAFLQKPSAAEIRAAGGLLENDQVTTGGGWQDQAGGIFPGAKLIHSGLRLSYLPGGLARIDCALIELHAASWIDRPRPAGVRGGVSPAESKGSRKEVLKRLESCKARKFAAICDPGGDLFGLLAGPTAAMSRGSVSEIMRHAHFVYPGGHAPGPLRDCRG